MGLGVRTSGSNFYFAVKPSTRHQLSASKTAGLKTTLSYCSAAPGKLNCNDWKKL